MTNLNLTNCFLLLVFFLISCKQSPKTADNSKNVVKEFHSSVDNDFEAFKANFEPIALNNLNELNLKFNNHYLANDDSLIEVSQAYKDSFLKDFNTDYMYYGFKTELPNNSVILTFLKHYGPENISDEEVIDTTFFSSFVFNDSGKFQSKFRSFGSNLTGEPPTYNMISTFENEKDKLIITNYEYSTGKSYSEVTPIPGSDSVYQADLIVTKYYLNYTTNEILFINKSRNSVKVAESYRSSLPVILRPVD